jgi:hypothetical protein
MCSSQNLSSLLRLRVIADANPGTIARVLDLFQNLNVTPRRVAAEFGIDEIMHIEVDVFGLPATQMDLVAAKIRQAVSVTDAYWHPL